MAGGWSSHLPDEAAVREESSIYHRVATRVYRHQTHHSLSISSTLSMRTIEF
jgi:DNA integrity scanning protein DisA with diadenylate cyclase activity